MEYYKINITICVLFLLLKKMLNLIYYISLIFTKPRQLNKLKSSQTVKSLRLKNCAFMLITIDVLLYFSVGPFYILVTYELLQCPVSWFIARVIRWMVPNWLNEIYSFIVSYRVLLIIDLESKLGFFKISKWNIFLSIYVFSNY